MKKIVMLLVLVGSVLAGNYSQPYSYDKINHLFNISEWAEYWVADDFEITEFGTELNSIVVWSTFAYPDEYRADMLNVVISLDDGNGDGPNGNTVVWEATIPTMDYMGTGDFWNSEILETTCLLCPNNRPILIPEETYYLELQFNNQFHPMRQYILASKCEIGTTCYTKIASEYWGNTSWIQGGTDLFFELNFVSCSLQPTTWADIKTTFGDN